jgi:hypothetical protein
MNPLFQTRIMFWYRTQAAELGGLRTKPRGSLSSVEGRRLGQNRTGINSVSYSNIVTKYAAVAIASNTRRTSFGTSGLWRDAGLVVLVNLLLLAEVVAGADAKAPLADFDIRASTRLDEIVSLAKPKWVEREIDLDLAKVRLPMLDYEFEALGRCRAEAWHRVGTLP